VATSKKDNPLAGSIDELTFLLEDGVPLFHDITCAVCLDIYEEPITLQCTHHFCEKCVKLLVQKAMDNAAKHIIACPLCRVETHFTKEGELNKNTHLKYKVEKMKRKSEADTSLSNKDTHYKIQKVTVPRSIKLLEEYDAAIGKGKRTFIPDNHTGFIGYGLDEEKENNTDLRYWRGIIIGPQESPIGQLIYNVQICVPDDYPKRFPEIRFTSPRIAMECVDSKGLVDVTKIQKVDMSTLDEGTGQVYETIGTYFTWDENLNIADVLIAIRENMHLESVCNDSSSLSGNYVDDAEDASDGDAEEKDE